MLLKFIKILLVLLQWRPNICHVVIPMAGLTILLRVGDLTTHFQAIDGEKMSQSISISSAHAATEPPQEPAPAAQPPATTQAAEQKDNKSKGEASESFDPLSLDENQIRVLKALANKSEGEADEEIQRRQKLLELSEKKLAEQVTNLEKLKSDVQTKKELLTKEERENIANTAKIYEAMKPEQAADIFNKIDPFVVAQLMKAMSQKKASLIIATMEGNKARALTIEMLRVQSPPPEAKK